MTAQQAWSVREREPIENAKMLTSAQIQDSNRMLRPSVGQILTVSTVWDPTPAHANKVRSCHFETLDVHKTLGYDYWAANAGCAEVDECTDPKYTSGSS